MVTAKVLHRIFYFYSQRQLSRTAVVNFLWRSGMQKYFFRKFSITNAFLEKAAFIYHLGLLQQELFYCTTCCSNGYQWHDGFTKLHSITVLWITLQCYPLYLNVIYPILWPKWELFSHMHGLSFSEVLIFTLYLFFVFRIGLPGHGNRIVMSLAFLIYFIIALYCYRSHFSADITTAL